MKQWLAGIALALSMAAALCAEPVTLWLSVEADADSGVFFDRQSLTRKGSGAVQGMIAIAWSAPDDAVFPDLTIKDVSVVEEAWEADCTANTISLLHRRYYSERGAHLKDMAFATPEPVVPRAGSRGEEILNLLCGRLQPSGPAVEGGAAALVEFMRKVRPPQAPPADRPKVS